MTVPVGVPRPGALTFTVAVNVTLLPYVDGVPEVVSVTLVLAGLTVTLAAPMLASKLSLAGTYSAARLWLPNGSVTTLLARPLLKATLPSSVVPSRKMMLPVGVPFPGAATPTLAVSVTFCPFTASVALVASVVVVPAVVTANAATALALALWLALPPYSARRLWLPTASVPVLNVATPLVGSVLVPSSVAPS